MGFIHYWQIKYPLFYETLITLYRIIGAKLSEKCKDVFSGIVTNVNKVSNLTSGISTASQEQSGGIDQVTKAVQNMDHITQQSAASAEETAAMSQELSAQAHSLMEQVQMLSDQLGGNGTLYAGHDMMEGLKIFNHGFSG